MGNAAGAMKRNRARPRVVLESPAVSETDQVNSKVRFANTRTGQPSSVRKPQMMEIGKIHADVYRGGRIKFQRSTSVGIGSTENVSSSKTSVQSTSSIRLEPTVDPYGPSTMDVEKQANGSAGYNWNSNNWRYNEYGTGPIVNGLARVDEI